MNRGSKARRWLLIWPPLVCALLASVTAVRVSNARPNLAGADPPLAFRIGEKLSYRISWAALMTAATAELAVNEKRAFYG
ncbi:MAG: hypothetical protein ACRD5F_03605, partial [Candidatus Acidiferrales bacterium]